MPEPIIGRNDLDILRSLPPGCDDPVAVTDPAKIAALDGRLAPYVWTNGREYLRNQRGEMMIATPTEGDTNAE